MTSVQEKLLQAKGLIDEALKEMGVVKAEGNQPRVSAPKRTATISGAVDFTTNARAFFKQHAGKLTGPKKFVLVLAYLAKGGETPHSTDEITQLWNQVGGVMGGTYAPVYSTRAKEQDWVDSPKYGSYVLRPNWKQIFD